MILTDWTKILLTRRGPIAVSVGGCTRTHVRWIVNGREGSRYTNRPREARSGRPGFSRQADVLAIFNRALTHREMHAWLALVAFNERRAPPSVGGGG
mgnify:CR=1 FL=1